ncbi:MAG TPA: class I SAM-dependent RNA methyltransferase [Candidatus Eisenbacteria bacterium]|nr:class I SAM-dependent RNA methyltransferase [Candidatus Eisenbacteria bacterium]
MLDTVNLPTLLGLEAMTSLELQNLGYKKSQITVTDGEVSLKVNPEEDIASTVAKLNFNLRTAERVLLNLGVFKAYDFDQLYDQTFDLPWQNWLDYQYFIEVVGYSRKSKLHSIPSCQGIIKKAIIDKLNLVYAYPNNIVPEDKDIGSNRIQFSLIENQLQLSLDTTGDPLHKRGYRPFSHEAPLRETLAAGILMISFYKMNLKNSEVLYDPFCGSGTFLIEAALLATNTAPGLERHFVSEKFQLIGKQAFDREREHAKTKSLIYNSDLTEELSQKPQEELAKMDIILPKKECRIFGSDISKQSIEAAQENAKRAKVSDLIDFAVRDIRDTSYQDLLSITSNDRILITANPPYGERLADREESQALEEEIRRISQNDANDIHQGIRLSLLTPDKNFEKIMGCKADRRRKLYNGGIACTLYHYFRFNRKARK